MTPDYVVPLAPGTGSMPLYCVHPVSGSVYPYLPLARMIGATQPVFGLEAPGYDDDRKPVALLPELSKRYIDAISRHARPQPPCLLGWSMGGAIAFDMACRMRSAGQPAALVILIDTLVPDPKPMPDDRLVLSLYVADLTGRPAYQTQRELDAIFRDRHLGEPDEDAFRALSGAGLIPDELEVESLSKRFAVFYAHLSALYGYRPRKGYPGPVVAIRAERSPAAVRSWADMALDVEDHTVPGDHYSIWQDGLAEISEITRRSLLRASTATPRGSTE